MDKVSRITDSPCGLYHLTLNRTWSRVRLNGNIPQFVNIVKVGFIQLIGKVGLRMIVLASQF